MKNWIEETLREQIEDLKTLVRIPSVSRGDPAEPGKPFGKTVYEALQAAGVPSDLILLDGAGHGEDAFYQPEIRSLILSFLQDCLGTGSGQRRRHSW